MQNFDTFMGSILRVKATHTKVTLTGMIIDHALSHDQYS